MIPKGERTELKSIVKQQFRVLRAECEQRQAELLANVEDEMRTRFATDDQAWNTCTHKVHEAVMEANRAINDALHEAGYQARGATERMWVQTPHIRKPQEDESQLRRVAHSHINEQTRAAKLALDRQEADMLRTLAIGAIESEEARAFLQSIPVVGELIPAARLAELEARLTEQSDTEIGDW